jgi:phenylacetate-coenzyme A ligase PaaK-like adenylate-forming protein
MHSEAENINRSTETIVGRVDDMLIVEGKREPFDD